jgi:hypothetical protein
MRRSMASSRTFWAFIVGPIAPCVLTGIGQAFTERVKDGMTWPQSFAGYTVLALPLAWILSYTLGTLVFVVLRYLKKEYVALYSGSGSLVGFVSGWLVGTGQSVGDRVGLGTIFAVLAASAALVFALIRGPDRKVGIR